MKPKFVHTSDIHLGKKFNNKNFSLKEREKRREELWSTFDEIIEMVKVEKIQYLFIVGDMIESEYFDFKGLKRIIQKFKVLVDTKVIITCGTSDACNINSMYDYVEFPKNVFVNKSTEHVQKINFNEDNLCIYSMNFSKSRDNENFQQIYDISVDEKKLNVLLLYSNEEKESEETLNNGLNIDLIKNKFDYCALGGKHNCNILKNNVIYPGTPEPISFEEGHEHGVIKGILEKKNVTYDFLNIAKRKFVKRTIEIDSTYGYNKILDLIKFSGDTFSNTKDYIRVNLIGTVNTDISIDEIKNESGQFFYYIEFEDNLSYKNIEEKKYEENEYNIIESYKLQFENLSDRLEKEAFKLGLDTLRKEKVVR
jgi:DNA repair exonuclease SbcCD nuclease subunit